MLGFSALFAQGVAAISPTMTAVLIIPLAFASAGAGTWLAYAFATVMLLTVVFCLNQFAKRSSVGGLHVRLHRPGTRSEGRRALGLDPDLVLLLHRRGRHVRLCRLQCHSSSRRSVITDRSIRSCSSHSAPCLCWVIAYKDIRVSSILTLVLEGASVACILALAFVILFKHGFKLDTGQLSLKGVGLHGMGLAVVACIFSLVGFESATALGGEAKDAKRTIPKAVTASLVITGLFMVFMAYVEVGGTNNHGAGWAPRRPLNYLAAAYNVSWFKIPISIGAMASFFSLSLSCLNAGARIMYPMARHGIFSGHLGKAHATNRTPHVAVTVYIAMIFRLSLGR